MNIKRIIIKHKKKTLDLFHRLSTFEKIWFTAIVFIGLILTILVPPFQKPDEDFHFRRSLALADGIIVCSNRESSYKYPTEFDTFQSKTAGIQFVYTQKYDYRNYLTALFTESNSYSSSPLGRLCDATPFGYVFQALVLKISSLINLAPVIAFFLGRLIGLFVYLSVLFFVIGKSDKNQRRFFLSFSSIPLVLHQAGSYSYDSLHITLSLGIGYLLFSSLNQKRISPVKFIGFVTLCIVFVLTKFYPLFLLLPFLIVDMVFIKLTKLKIFIGVVAVVTLILITWKFYLPITEYLNSSKSEASLASQQLEIILNDPSSFQEIVTQTTQERFVFYYTSLIGTLGWVDYNIDPIAALAVLYLVISSSLKCRTRNRIRFPVIKLLTITLIILTSYIFILLSLYIYFTPSYTGVLNYPIVEGVQGRYFVVLLPLLPITIALFQQLATIKNFLKYVVICIYCLLIINAVLSRYLWQ